jgi:Dolichyl-phosphate-mannose-protein mannosyltransferase
MPTPREGFAPSEFGSRADPRASTNASGSHRHRGQALFAALIALGLLVYASVLWGWFRPDFIQTWRETDTQTIARHLAEPGASIFFPRIDWGGAGPGYVETEFQLYTWLVSRVLILTGDAEWPAQAVSLVTMLAAAWLVFTQLRRRYGQVPAGLGLVAMLATRGFIQCSTTIQPESLCFLLFATAWFALLSYADSGQRRWLFVYALSGGLAMLVKPTAGQLGIASFVLLWLQARPLLKRAEIWIAWGAMVGALVLHLAHARQLYLEYGNTFGVLSGGDSKLPKLEHLLIPQLYLKAALNSVLWGVGPIGAAATLTALIRRRGAAPLLALLVAIVVWTLLTLRYTTFAGGNHYHVLGGVLAAQSVAHVYASLPVLRMRRWSEVLVLAALAVHMADSLRVRDMTRRHSWDEPQIAAARALSRHARPGDLIVARSAGVRYNTYWRTISNYEDPRVFYLSKTRGWPIGLEASDAIVVERAQRSGARYFVEPGRRDAMPSLDAWLSEHATLLETTEYGGKIYALAAPDQASLEVEQHSRGL